MLERGSIEEATGAEKGRVPAFLDRARHFAAAFVRKHSEDDVSVHAMSLTYTTILSMVPLLAVTFSVLKAFGIHNQVQPFLARTLSPLGPEGVAVSERITEFVGNMEVGVLGAAGIAGLFYTVVSLVGSIEHAFNHIWQARRGRNWSHKARDYLTVVLIGPVLVFSALALIASAEQYTLVRRIFAFAPGVIWVATAVLPYVILSVAFTLLLRFMPNTHVTWGAAAVGGIATGIAWKLAGSTFTAFIASSTRYTAIYSSFAILILFFLWVYASWLIVLVGAEIGYAWQYPHDVMSRLRDTAVAARERNGLRLLVVLASAHFGGEPPLRASDIAVRSGLPSSFVEDVVERMIRSGFLLAVERPPGFALARPPGSIAVTDVLAVLRGEDRIEPLRSAPPAVDIALERRRLAGDAALEGVSLEDLAADETGSLSDGSSGA